MHNKDEFSLIKDIIINESNYIPLFSMEDEEMLKNENIDETIPLLPLLNTILFPGMVIPITVGRNKSLRLVQDYAHSDKTIGVVTQRDSNIEEPTKEDIFSVGTLAHIMKSITMPDGSVTIIVQGLKRFSILDIVQKEPYYKAHVTEYATNEFDNEIKENETFKALVDSIRDTASNIIKLSGSLPREANYALKNIESPVFLLNFLASNLSTNLNEKQRILEMQDIVERGKLILKLLNKDLQMAELKNQIQNKSKEEIDKQQREYFLNQQMKTIQQELGGTQADIDTEELLKKAETKKWDAETRKIFDKELAKLQRTNPMAAQKDCLQFP